MQIIKFTFILITIFGFTYGQNYKKVKIYLDEQKSVGYLTNAGIALDHFEVGRDNSITAFITDDEYLLIKNLGLRNEVLIEDWYKFYNSQPKLSPQQINEAAAISKSKYGVSGFRLGSMGGYLTLSEVYAELDTLKKLFPNLISAEQYLGNTIGNLPVYAVKISDNPDEDEDEPEVLYTALHHAREPMSMMQMIYFMYYLLENYNTEPAVQYLVNNRELYFIPVVNPDGYEYNRSQNPSGGGMWRKNRRNNGSSFGVDLNRNYGPYEYWNAPNGGSSTNPGSDTYRGTAPFSEPETQIIRDFLASREIKNALNYHTFSNLLIYPYGALSQETPDSVVFREFAADMTKYNNYAIGTDMQTVGYSTRGNSDDYFYDGDILLNSGKIYAMTPEVGGPSDHFWPAQNRIFPLAQENVFPNLYYAWVAGEYVSLDNPNFNQSYFNPGDFVQFYPSLKNKGLAAGHDIRLELTSLNPYVQVNSMIIELPQIDPRTIIGAMTPLSFSISSITPLETGIDLLFIVTSAGVEMSRDTIEIIVGYPEFIFLDTADNPLDFWIITSTPATPSWEAVSNTFYSAPTCFTDSRIGNYANDAIVTMTLMNPINLSAYNNPKLSFWTRYDIETGWDYGQVEISTNNGNTWIALAGHFTKSGTGTFQPNGKPIYDGYQSNWVREEIDLNLYNSNTIKIRFKLITDGAVQRDGWYLDDIGILVYTAVPVELTSFTCKVEQNNVMLSWQTSTELNNYGFEVERCLITSVSNGNGASDWVKLGFVDGSGSTADIKTYSFIDNNLRPEKYLYRLKQIDLNGSYKYSNAVEVEILPVKFSLEQNYPNPFNPSTKIDWQTPVSGWQTLKIYDVLGNEVATLVNEFREAGRYSFDFNLDILNNDFSTGIYFYKLTSGKFIETKKMTVIK